MWRSHSFRSALSRRLLLAALAPLAIIAVFSVIFVRGLLADQVARSVDLHATALAAHVSQALEVPKAVVAPYLGQTYREVLDSGDPERMWSDAADNIPEVESLLLLDDRGVVQAAAMGRDTGFQGARFVGLDRSRDPAVARALAERLPVWSDVYLSPITGESALSYVAPIRTGAIVVNLTLTDFADYSLGTKSAVLSAMIDRNGVPVYYPEPTIETQRPNMRSVGIIDEVLSGAQSAQGRYELYGVEYLGAAHTVEEVGWVALAAEPWDAAREAILETQYVVILIILLAVGFALLLSFAFSKRLAGPVGALATHADRVTRGEYGDAPVGYRERELQVLGTALGQMTDAVKKREDDLAASARQYRFLIESLRAVPWEYEMDSDRFVYVGPQAERLLGTSPGSWTDLDSWARTLHPDDRDTAVNACLSAAARGEDHNLEYRVVRPDGEIVWIDDIVSLHADASGTVRLVGVMLDISELKEAARLRVAAAAAEAASDAKSSFLANMSHEFRTPLNSILGFGNILVSQLAGPINDEQERQLGMIVRSGNHLLALVNDVLDLEKIEAGAMPIDLVEFDAAELVTSAAEIMAPMAQSRGLFLNFSVPDTGLRVRADEDRVRQVLLNLFSNAVKFTDVGGVTITLDAIGDLARVTVTDTGIGIPGDRLTQVFDEFKSMGRPGDSPRGGTGLGLPISRRLARLMGGDVVLLRAQDDGSTFVFTFELDATQFAALD